MSKEQTTNKYNQNKVGTVRKSKAGNTYIQLDKDVAAGSRLMVKDPRKNLDDLVAAGKMKQEKAEEIKAKIPDYISKELELLPSKE